MVEFKFAKGSDFTIKLNDCILGGVKSAVCVQNVKFNDVVPFLSDKPVYRSESCDYVITLTMNYAVENPFCVLTDNSTLQLCADSTTVKYSGCRISRIESRVNSIGDIEDVVTISAEERKIL